MAMPNVLRVHGLDLSYFTGKLEAYLRNKQIPYELIEMDTSDFKRCGKATGVAQMPQVEWLNGQWLSDSTLIIEFLEGIRPETTIMPDKPALRFVAQLLEDFGDEWLWRPALYYRWANAKDARLMSTRLAEGMMRDVPIPLFMRRWAILNRQRYHFLWRDGVRPGTAKRIEAHYLETLDALEQILSTQHFLLGERPTLADYGFYGGMFRHFFCDPTPAAIMRKRAPAVHEWVARMWNTRLECTANHSMPEVISENLRPLFKIIAQEFLPYMQANETAIEQGRARFRFDSQGTPFSLPTQRYRAWRFQRLRMRYQQLTAHTQTEIHAYCPALGEALLKAVTWPVESRIKELPITTPTTTTSRAW